MFKVTGDNAILKLLKNTYANTDFTLVKKYLTQKDNLVYYKNKLYLTLDAEDAIIKDFHESPLHGHQGITRTYNRILNYYNTYNLRRKVQAVIKDCTTCAKAKASRHKPYGYLKPIEVPEHPQESIAIDFITKLPNSIDPITTTEYDSILVIVD